MRQGKVHLIPNLLSDASADGSIPSDIKLLVKRLKHFMVENEKVARRYLKKLDRTIIIDELTFYSMGKHADSDSVESALRAVRSGNDIGVVSDAGCPGIADPGSLIVERAQRDDIPVIPHVGPSSILMTLMASGLNGQKFSFHGYLPKDRNERIHKLKSISQSIARDRSTHLFMDTPFRNKQLLEDILKSSPERNRLCIARDITGEKEWIKTKTIAQWKNENPDINKMPVMFALGH